MRENKKRNLNTNKIIPFGVKIEGDYFPPPSKSFAIRNLIVASLSEKGSLVKNIDFSEDVKSAIRVVKKWRKVKLVAGNEILIGEWKGKIPNGKFYVGGSATIARILLALFSFIDGKRVIDGNYNLKKRDFSSTIKAAKLIGLKVTELGNTRHLPILVEGKKIKCNKIKVCDENSSQFASGVLIALSFLKRKWQVRVEKKVSFPYVKITEEVLKKFGAKIKSKGKSFFLEKSVLKGNIVETEKDYSQSAFFTAGAVVTGGKIKIYGLNKKSKQGDKVFLDILKKSGVRVSWKSNFLEIYGFPKKGLDVNLKKTPDLLPPLSVIALKSPTESLFRGISRLSTKESSRAYEIAQTINKIGGKAKIYKDYLRIEPSNRYIGKTLDPKNDHRLAMAYAFYGILAEGTKIKKIECVKKSYPTFWKDFKSIIKRN